MSGGTETYNELLGIIVFLSALWLAGFICKLVKISPIVGQILTGIVLGPNTLDFVPLFQGECDVEHLNETGTEAEHHILAEPTKLGYVGRMLQTTEEILEEALFELEGDNIWVVLGELGVALLIMESGLHVDFKTLKKVGAPAFLVAVLGTFLPLLLGMGFSAMLGLDVFPTGLGVGAVLAPTSVGIALKLLHEANVLNSQFGQTIVTAAFTDDIFSIVTLTVLLALAAGELTAWSVIEPFLFSFLFLGGTFALAIYVFPKYVAGALHWISERFGSNYRDIAHLAFMFIVLGIYALIGSLIGSHLLGAFVSGVSFVKVPRTHLVWEREMSVINRWLLAIFFGATVGFAVPTQELLSLDIFWKGMVIGLIPGIMGKVLAGIALPQRWVVGWAMVGRGEFAFLVAQTLRETPYEGELNENGEVENFITDEAFAIACWALLLATFVAPIVFGIVLAGQMKSEEVLEGDAELKKMESNLDGKKSSFMIQSPKSSASIMKRMSSVMFGRIRETIPRSQWYITVGTPYQRHLLKDLMKIFDKYDIEVKSFVNEGDANTDLFTFTVLIVENSSESDPAIQETFQKKASIMRQRTNKDFGADEEEGTMPRKRNSIQQVQFKHKFFEFDINIMLDKLKHEIMSVTHNKATISMDRSNAVATRRMLPLLGTPAGGPIPEEDGEIDDDEDSVVEGNKEKKPKNEDELDEV